MVAMTDPKVRLFDLTATALELVRDGKRDPWELAELLQVVKENPDFAKRFGIRPIPITLEDWEQFDREIFGKKADYAGLAVPERTDLGRLWPIVIPEWASMNQIISVQRGHGVNTSTYIADLDGDISVHDRDSKNGTYVIACRARVEADEELKTLSANDLADQETLALTLLERLRLGFLYWWKTKKHLDQKSQSLCAGSRSCGDSVPCVDWYPGSQTVYVGRYDPSGRNDYVRARLAVS
jgi:hypothetical protein